MEEAISDPTGFQAILTDDCWQHIVSRHPEMQSFRQFVLETIREPDAVYSGKRDPSRRIYRKRYLQVPEVGDTMTFWFLSAARIGMSQRRISQRIRCACWVL
jgi:hypothetical protein